MTCQHRDILLVSGEKGNSSFIQNTDKWGSRPPQFSSISLACTRLRFSSPQCKIHYGQVGPLHDQKKIHDSVPLSFHTNGRLEPNLDFALWGGEWDWYPFWKSIKIRTALYMLLYCDWCISFCQTYSAICVLVTCSPVREYVCYGLWVKRTWLLSVIQKQ